MISTNSGKQELRREKSAAGDEEEEWRTRLVEGL